MNRLRLKTIANMNKAKIQRLKALTLGEFRAMTRELSDDIKLFSPDTQCIYSEGWEISTRILIGDAPSSMEAAIRESANNRYPLVHEYLQEEGDMPKCLHGALVVEEKPAGDL